MEPDLFPENSLVYKEKICWFGVRRKKHVPLLDSVRTFQEPCGLTALCYRVARDGAPGPKAFFWLCDSHVKKMRDLGYTVVHVPR